MKFRLDALVHSFVVMLLFSLRFFLSCLNFGLLEELVSLAGFDSLLLLFFIRL